LASIASARRLPPTLGGTASVESGHVVQDRLFVRVLVPGDASLLRELLSLFGRVFEDAETYCAYQPDDDYLEKLLSSDTFIAIVAIEESKAIGGLAGYVLPKFEQVRSEFYIYDLAVDERHRRKGVATAMIEKLREIVVSRGVYVIFVQADLNDKPAIALYTSLGNREDVLHFDIAPQNGAT
jgi:aminoglycoside 3-N-acetyltransferase I